MATDSPKIIYTEQVEDMGDLKSFAEKQPDAINAVVEVQQEDEKISWRVALAFIVGMILSANMQPFT
jgi:hypothetical protein